MASKLKEILKQEILMDCLWKYPVYMLNKSSACLYKPVYIGNQWKHSRYGFFLAWGAFEVIHSLTCWVWNKHQGNAVSLQKHNLKISLQKMKGKQQQHFPKYLSAWGALEKTDA